MKRHLNEKRQHKPNFRALYRHRTSTHKKNTESGQPRPDFSKLDNSKSKHSLDFFSLLIFYFFLISIGGFFWEVLILLVMDGQFRKRGFFYGPWIPIYGIGAVLLSVLFSLISDTRLLHLPARDKSHSHGIMHYFQKSRSKIVYPSIVFLISSALGATLELLTGWMLNHFWQLRYWDYRNYFLNFHGYICFSSVLGFGIAGTLWICFLADICAGLWLHLPGKIRKNVNTLLLLLLLLDFASALILPNMGLGITFPSSFLH